MLRWSSGLFGTFLLSFLTPGSQRLPIFLDATDSLAAQLSTQQDHHLENRFCH